MGQTHSDSCDVISSGYAGTVSSGAKMKDVADSELNTNNSTVREQSRMSSAAAAAAAARADERQQHVRKLSNVSHRNIQLLSMKPRSEKDAYADDLRTRRRSSLINLILGAPSSGPRFCDDLCSLSSHLSEVYFGIESFPEPHHYGCGGSTSTLRLASIEDIEKGGPTKSALTFSQKVRRRSSFGSLAAIPAVSDNPTGPGEHESGTGTKAPPSLSKGKLFRNPSLASTLASIDLTSSFEQHCKPSSQIPVPTGGSLCKHIQRPPLTKSSGQLGGNTNPAAVLAASGGQLVKQDARARVSRGRINQSARMIRRTGSELSLYSTISADSSSGSSSQASGTGLFRPNEPCCARDMQHNNNNNIHRETKLIILLQVALPFMLAGFGNMAAGLVLDLVAQRHAFVSAPILFVLLPPLIGLKGNIEMTLASRFSTLSNLNLLQTGHQRRRAYASNLTLVVSQAIGLSLFAAAVSILCELSMFGPSGPQQHHHQQQQQQQQLQEANSLKLSLAFGSTTLAVFASALTTSVVLVILSSIVMSCAVIFANLIQVNPDNLSTLIAAMYGDVSCVYVYGLVADWMFSLMEKDLLVWPSIIVASTLLLWPITLFLSYKFKETHNVALYSMPPMIISIMISMGSGALLSMFVGRFRLIALYQPVVNGFGANLVAVQASRVSTWLWCSALGKLPPKSKHDETGEPKEPPSKVIGSLASFAAPKALPSGADGNSQLFVSKLIKMLGRSVKLILWSFFNSSPNAIAARLLLLMLIPAHTIYFFVIWLLSTTSHVIITWQFYTVYIGLCLIQVFILLTICEPFMTWLMSRNMDPDVFGISILMAVADLAGTICLTLAFFMLASIGDVNSLQ